MFIELTDHLRCPAPHEEAFLVLVPYEMDGRMVVRGVLGCPICQREFRITHGVAVFELNGRTGEAAPGLRFDRSPPTHIVAFLGLEGPGGYLGLFGGRDPGSPPAWRRRYPASTSWRSTRRTDGPAPPR